MLQNLTGMHALVILAVVVLIFGASKLPALARSVGQSVKILKKETSDAELAESAESPTTSGPAASAGPAGPAASATPVPPVPSAAPVPHDTVAIPAAEQRKHPAS